MLVSTLDAQPQQQQHEDIDEHLLSLDRLVSKILHMQVAQRFAEIAA
jgi:hypothetical protein